MSGTPVTFAPTTRCPSSNVRVRMVPRPRSEKELRPCWPLDVLNVPVAAPVDPCSEGSCAMVLNTLGCALLAICSSPMTVVGVGALKPLVVMRDPVTTMSAALGGGVSAASCGGATSCAGAAAGAVWAWAVWAWAMPASAMVARAVRLALAQCRVMNVLTFFDPSLYQPPTGPARLLRRWFLFLSRSGFRGTYDIGRRRCGTADFQGFAA